MTLLLSNLVFHCGKTVFFSALFFKGIKKDEKVFQACVWTGLPINIAPDILFPICFFLKFDLVSFTVNYHANEQARFPWGVNFNKLFFTNELLCVPVMSRCLSPCWLPSCVTFTASLKGCQRMRCLDMECSECCCSGKRSLRVGSFIRSCTAFSICSLIYW